MAPREKTDDQIKAEILDKLMRRGRWGGHYLPVDTLVNWLGKGVKGNGSRVRNMIVELHRGGYLLTHKGGRTISLRSDRQQDIYQFLEENL